MKSLHRDDLYGWAAFDTPRNVDFNGTFWARAPEGGKPPENVAIDPMPLSEHDAAHIEQLGGVAWVVLTNADHARTAAGLAARFGARIAAPGAEKHRPELAALSVDLWLSPGDEHPTGLRCLAMNGSKTEGELAFLLPGGDTVITGDLVRGQRAGRLNLLPDPKLSDRGAAIDSVRELAALPNLQAVIVGDGQSIFRDARARLNELLEELSR